MWTKLSADKKSELMKAYKKGGFSYRDMIDDYNTSYEKFEVGGENNPTIKNTSLASMNTSYDNAVQNYSDKIDPYLEKVSANYLNLKNENSRVLGVRERAAQIALEKSKSLNPSTRTDLSYIKNGAYYCNTHTGECFRDAGATTPSGDKVPVIPGNLQWDSNMPNYGFQWVDNPQAGDVAREQLYRKSDYQGNQLSPGWYTSHSGVVTKVGTFAKDTTIANAPGGSRFKYENQTVNDMVHGRDSETYKMRYQRYVGNIPELEKQYRQSQTDLNNQGEMPIKQVFINQSNNYPDQLQKYQEGGIEKSINKRLGDPMNKAEIDSDYKGLVVDPRTRRQHEAAPVDNVRHAAAGRYTQEAIESYANLIPYASAIPGFSKAAGFIGSNVLGLGHEASTLFNNDDDTRPWGLKLKESAADAYNNMIGSVIGASNLTPYQKNAYIKYLSETGKMPTGQYNKKKDPTYKKEMGGIQKFGPGGTVWQDEGSKNLKIEIPKTGLIDRSLMDQPNFASETVQSQAPVSKYAAADQNKAAVKAAIEGHAETAYNKHLQREELKKKYPTKNQEEIQRIQDKIESPLFYEPAGQLASYVTRFHGLTDDELGDITGSGTMGNRLGVTAEMAAWALANEVGGKAIGKGIEYAAPYIKKGLNAVGKAIGTEEGLLSNVYKINTWAENLNDPLKSYRVAGMDAARDFEKTGVLRSVQQGVPEGASLTERAMSRPTGFPSFQKGYADMRYLPKEGGVVFETALPTFKRGQLNPVTGFSIKGRHYAHRVIDPKTGATMTEIPGEHIRMFGGKPHWLQGYKQVEVPKTTQNFKSEINWGQWNKEIPDNPQLMQEYNAIEQTSKANGSWMKNPDGSSFQGTPEQFVQQNSENFKKYVENAKGNYNDVLEKPFSYHGSSNNNITEFHTPQDSDYIKATADTPEAGIFLTNEKSLADIYATKNKNGKAYELYAPANYARPALRNPNNIIETSIGTNIEKPILTGNLDLKDVEYLKSLNYTGIADHYLPNSSLEKVVFDKNIIKSAVGNNGMFDITNPNIYKALFPTAVGAAALNQKNKNKINK